MVLHVMLKLSHGLTYQVLIYPCLSDYNEHTIYLISIFWINVYLRSILAIDVMICRITSLVFLSLLWNGFGKYGLPFTICSCCMILISFYAWWMLDDVFCITINFDLSGKLLVLKLFHSSDNDYSHSSIADNHIVFCCCSRWYDVVKRKIFFQNGKNSIDTG